MRVTAARSGLGRLKFGHPKVVRIELDVSEGGHDEWLLTALNGLVSDLRDRSHTIDQRYGAMQKAVNQSNWGSPFRSELPFSLGEFMEAEEAHKQALDRMNQYNGAEEQLEMAQQYGGPAVFEGEWAGITYGALMHAIQRHAQEQKITVDPLLKSVVYTYEA